MMRIKFFLLGCLLLLSGCQQSYQESKQQRMQFAADPDNQQQPIVIGVPWKSAKDDFFIAGVKLAVKEINQKGGVLNKVPLQLDISESESLYFNHILPLGIRRNVIFEIAKRYAANPQLIAVVGHSSTEPAMMASVIYENSGIVFLATNSRFGKLTGHNFNYTFRTSLNNAMMAEQLADFAAQKGYKQIAVLSSRTDSTDEFVNEFTAQAIEKHHIDIVYRRSFFESMVDIVSLVADLKSVQKMDAIFLATGDKNAAQIYQQIRNVGIKLPIIGNVTLDTQEFWGRVKQWEYSDKVQKSHIPTLFNTSTAKGKQFDLRFQQEYGQEADYLAALGYDSIHLLAHAIQLAKSRVPLEIATTLRYMTACKGVSGSYAFERNGDLKSKPVSFYYLAKNDYAFERVNNGTVLDEPKMDVCDEIDRDHDGIPTAMDVCPDTTPVEMAKGVYQDGAERGCPIDSDKDGVSDYKDSCPTNTEAEISKGVDARGCPVDFDKDGIPDYRDTDVDGDKVANNLDKCPKSTVAELKYGANLTGKQAGCPVDSDADGVLDYLDSCRTNTAEEISQGVDAAGCPVDNDLDGVLDYQDKCLKTLKNGLVDAQGCDVVKATMTLKPEAFLFAAGQVKLTSAGAIYLDGLVADSHLPLLKKIQLIGYTDSRYADLFQNRLSSMSEYLQQQSIPLEAIEIVVKNNEPKKNNGVEFIFSEVQIKPEPVETPAKPASSTTPALHPAP